ncbi:MAG TPA: glycine cleavage system aminomethyltransferase GcvT [Candidatus Aminicenantes bacterium]|nr:MAG: glycine cleavage system protein T [Candidatus Aminicenantes bacterium]HEK85093.1 glycine cleavage system aminomethyltransferase GcvT [Candidatus Aminicenantes bacterium]
MKKTRLNAVHRQMGARMIEFAGWEMPVEYRGLIDEHLAVRTRAGLFDVSHMGEIFIEGPEALACVQYLTPNDVARLSPGMVQYTALTTPEGTFVDDMLVYCLSLPDRYLLVVNAANTDKDYAWVKEKSAKFNVQVTNRSDDYSQLALQGPLAEKILQPLTDINLGQMKSFNFAFGKVVGVDCLVSRTGYTGEDGFEIYTLSSNPEIIWKAIIDKGTPLGLLPVGLGARDTLRLEAKLMLYGNDITDKTTVLEADLKWIIKFQKGDFLGKAVLEKQLQEGLKKKLVGFEMVDKGIARPHYPVFINQEKVSEVCSGTFAPFLKKAIGLVYLPIDHTEIGSEFEVGIRDKKLKARVVATPFYKREKSK